MSHRPFTVGRDVESHAKRGAGRGSCSSSSSSRRRGDRRAAAAGHGTAARRSRAAATAAHPTTPSAAPRRPSVAPGLCTHNRICSLVRPLSKVPHRRKRQPAARTARAIALVGVFGQALKRPPRPLVSCVAARSLVSGGGAGRVCRATLQQPRCARNQHACCLPSHRAVARRPPPPAFRRAPPDAEACSFSIAAKQERHLANDAAHPFMDELGHGKNTAWASHP